MAITPRFYRAIEDERRILLKLKRVVATLTVASAVMVLFGCTIESNASTPALVETNQAEPTPTQTRPTVSFSIVGVGTTQSHSQLGLLGSTDDNIRLIVRILDGPNSIELFMPLADAPPYLIKTGRINSISTTPIKFTPESSSIVFEVVAFQEDDLSQLELLMDLITGNVPDLVNLLGDSETTNPDLAKTYVGSYQAVWSEANAWGSGTYEAVGEGDLRLWFQVDVDGLPSPRMIGRPFPTATPLPTATPRPTPRPTSTPAPTVRSAGWTDTAGNRIAGPVKEGTSVRLVAEFDHMSDGRVKVIIWEWDTLLGACHRNIEELTMTVEGGKGSAQWRSEWFQDDIFDFVPEFKFEVLGQYSTLLEVTQTVVSTPTRTTATPRPAPTATATPRPAPTATATPSPMPSATSIPQPTPTAAAASSTAAQLLLERYAPVLMMHPEETYFPIDVNILIDNSDLRQDLFEGTMATELNAESLRNLKGSDLYLDFREASAVSGTQAYRAWYVQNEASYDPFVYTRIAEIDGSVILQYWFFYLFNDWTNAHEGDWEFVQLKFAGGSIDDVINLNDPPVEIGLGVHISGYVGGWNAINRVGDHPVVFVAEGSHANYPLVGDGSFEAPSPAIGTDRVSSSGVALVSDSEINMGANVNRQYVLSSLEDAPWLTFGGHWGERCLLTFLGCDSPRGPASSGQRWNSPTAWANGLNPLLTEAKWTDPDGNEITAVNRDNPVSLVIKGSAPDGFEATVVIEERDGFFAEPRAQGTATFSNGVAVLQWAAEWILDGFDGDPEYTFRILGIESPLLVVK